MAELKQKIGRFEVISRLGQGGMGEVFKARDPSIDREVAVKIITKEDMGGSSKERELLERFHIEAKAAGKLNHQNIVTVYEMGEERGTFYIAMEYVEGASLSQVLSQDRSMEMGEILGILRQIASALDAAHAKGVIHRDIKPGNIMVTEDGTCKVTDFGVARLGMGSGLTVTGHTVGSPSYMSPEQVQGRQVDGRSDLFSLGVIFYQLATGEKPFTGENVTTTIYKILHENPLPLTALNHQLNPRLDDVMRKILAKNPKERYQNGREFIDDLERAIGDAEDAPTKKQAPVSRCEPTVSVPTPTGIPARKERGGAPWMGVAAAVVLVVAGLVFYSMKEAPVKESEESVVEKKTIDFKTLPVEEEAPAEVDVQPDQVDKAEIPPAEEVPAKVGPSTAKAPPTEEAPVKAEPAPTETPPAGEEPVAEEPAPVKPEPPAKPLDTAKPPPSGEAQPVKEAPKTEVDVQPDQVDKAEIPPAEEVPAKVGPSTAKAPPTEEAPVKAELVPAKAKPRADLPQPGKLIITEPKGAKVTLRRKIIGTAPLDIDFPPGAYTFVIKPRHGKPFRKKVVVPGK